MHKVRGAHWSFVFFKKFTNTQGWEGIGTRQFEGLRYLWSTVQRMVDGSIYLICYYATEMSKHDKNVHGARRLKIPYPIQTPSEPSALRISLQVAVMKINHTSTP